jgi:hypothetical protein
MAYLHTIKSHLGYIFDGIENGGIFNGHFEQLKAMTWRRGIVVSSPLATEEIGAMCREIESLQGIGSFFFKKYRRLVYIMALWYIFDHLVYFLVIWYIFFVIWYIFLSYIFPVWQVVPRKIWQPPMSHELKFEQMLLFYRMDTT